MNTQFGNSLSLKRPSLSINVLSNWVALAITILVGFLLTPFIISHLGKTGYGIWILIGSIIGYYGFLDLGVTSAITRYVSRYAGQRNYKLLNNTISTSLLLFCVIGIVIAAASFLIAAPLTRFFKVEAQHVDSFRQLVWILGLAAGLGFPGNLFGAVIRAHERFVTANSVTIIITLIRAGLIVLFLSNGLGLLGIAFSHLISVVVMIVLNYTFCKVLFSYFSAQLNQFKWSILGLLLGFGAATVVATLADIMRFNLDSFVIAKWVDLPSVAIYGIAALIVRFFLQFIANATTTVLTPRFAALDGIGNKDQLKRLFLKSLSVAAFLSFATGTLIIILGKHFVFLWVGRDFVDSIPILWVLAICYSIALAQTPGISLVYALKKHYLFAAASIVEGIVNVILSIYLAPRYGVLGVAIGTAIPMLAIKLILQPIYVSRIMGISLVRYWRPLIPAFFLAVVVIMIGRDILQIPFLGNGYISLAISAAPFIAVFIILYLLVHIVTKKREIQQRFS